MDSKPTTADSQTLRSESRVQNGIVVNWGNKWNPLLRRPRKTYRHIDTPESEIRRRNKSRGSAVRSRFSVFMRAAAKSSLGSAKSTLAGRSEASESLAGDAGYDAFEEEDCICAADIAYKEGHDHENPYQGEKGRLMRQYQIWNGVNLKKVGLPPLPTQDRQRSTLADAWRTSDQAARQLGNITRRGPKQTTLNKAWQTQSLPDWKTTRGELEEEETAVQKIVRDAVCHGAESNYSPSPRPMTAPGVIYDPRTTWTVKCMLEARMNSSRCSTSRVSAIAARVPSAHVRELDTAPLNNNNQMKDSRMRADSEWGFSEGSIVTVSDSSGASDFLKSKPPKSERLTRNELRNTAASVSRSTSARSNCDTETRGHSPRPAFHRSISSCGRYDFKHSMKLDSHHLSRRREKPESNGSC